MSIFAGASYSIIIDKSGNVKRGIKTVSGALRNVRKKSIFKTLFFRYPILRVQYAGWVI